MNRMILASQSPRRRQLLAQAGLVDFEILSPSVDESYDPALSPAEIVRALSRRKAEAAVRQGRDLEALVIAADTMVFLDDLRLGKPHSQQEAFDMLTALSGRTHEVLTGLTLIRGGQAETQSDATSVEFRPLSDQEKWSYIRTGEPMDKAGAYGVQGKAALFVTGIRGDYFNVMGLPLHLLGRMLSGFGVELFP